MSQEQQLPFTLLARVVRPQGRHGEALCELLTNFPDKFAERKRLFLLSSESGPVEDAREVQLEDFWMPQGKNAGRVVLKLAGCDSIEDVEKLAGKFVGIPRAERASLEEDEFFVCDLLDCEIVTAGERIGRVAEVDMTSTGSPLLVVKSDTGEEILIPLAQAYLVRVDLPAKRIEMKLPDGLVEVNRQEQKNSNARTQGPK